MRSEMNIKISTESREEYEDWLHDAHPAMRLFLTRGASLHRGAGNQGGGCRGCFGEIGGLGGSGGLHKLAAVAGPLLRKTTAAFVPHLHPRCCVRYRRHMHGTPVLGTLN